MPVVDHEARVVKVFQLPVMDSQPQFWAQQEVQTEPPSPPTEQGVHEVNAQAENLLQLIQANFMCPIVAPATYCPEGHAACIYCLMQSALHQGFERCPDAVVSLMDGISREFVDISTEDGESQEDELRSYARGPIRDNWQVRSRLPGLGSHCFMGPYPAASLIDSTCSQNLVPACIHSWYLSRASHLTGLDASHLETTSYRYVTTQPFTVHQRLPAPVKLLISSNVQLLK
ncbi:uncharacterized protein F5891DRAFT_986805 [Suillus fuscotomentosus]|uniref:Uncharacterized protein n=1 Tax=Suillus fuscotomentosus TaxID=1912939 RepID=A0AAD4DT64_9AGAM|nr:uncharacterized protein F5891DRAFT_986805 [Suillus fuscotomentosus]KAG1890708.1 hypothetical protein F5891DRAFT_986805 [Suillus fuscotomentosus]